jgi:hypothetical protein
MNLLRHDFLAGTCFPFDQDTAAPVRDERDTRRHRLQGCAAANQSAPAAGIGHRSFSCIRHAKPLRSRNTG